MSKTWIDISAEKIAETPKAVLLDFGADRGCTHQKWVPKSHYREVAMGHFHPIQQVTTWIAKNNNLYIWIGR